MRERDHWRGAPAIGAPADGEATLSALGKQGQPVLVTDSPPRHGVALFGRPTWVALALLLASPIAVLGEFSHAEWDAVLARFVDERGLVDYAGIAGNRSALDRYLKQLESTSPDSAAGRFPGRNDQLAYWINAYNALVVAGVLERGIDTPSVWGDGLFGIGFFTARRWRLGGQRLSLKEIEDQIVRGRFADPRIHAVLNCASLGCPQLPRRAFQGATLDADLDAAMREFVAETRNCRIDLGKHTVWLSKIFDWFESDFLEFEARQGTRNPTVADYVNRYRAPDARIPAGLRVRFLAYDKRLNRQGAQPGALP